MNNERDKLLDECMETIRGSNYNCVTISPTGSGKSFLLIQSLKELFSFGKNKILYTCDNRRLRDIDFPNELIKWGVEEIIPYIEFKCYQSTYKWVDEEYDILLMDEADYGLTPSYIKLLQNNKFKHIIAVTATLSETKKKLIEKYIPIVTEIFMKDIEGKGIVNKAEAFICNTMLSPSENARYLGYNTTFQRMLNGSVNQKQLQFLQFQRRMFLGNLESSASVVRRLSKQIVNKDETNKVIIFCNFSEQASKVAKYSYHSLNNSKEYLDWFDEGKINILSVVGKIDRGINLKGVNYSIFESTSGSSSKSQQKSGRLRRLPIDETCKLIFICPHFKDRNGMIKPTIVRKYIEESTIDLGLKFKEFNYV